MLLNQIIHYGLEAAEKFNRLQTSPEVAQWQVLRKLLTNARNTAYGKAYDFAGLLKAKNLTLEFQNQVPLADYNDLFTPWWERVYEGQKDITWPGRPDYFAMSSGTSGAATKYIPITKAMLKSLSKGAFRMFSTFPDYELGEDIYTTSWLSIGGTTELKTEGKRQFGYLSGINAREQPVWARSFYKPGREIAGIADFDERMEAIARKAPEWDIGVIVGIPHWVQLTLERIVEMHKLDNIADIWPNVKLFVSGGVDYEPYVKSFTRLIGHPIKYLNTYLASEGMFAFQRHPDAPGMQLLLDNGIYYEFLPFNEENFDEEGDMRPNRSPLTINQVAKGVDYAMLISTCSGAWRYLVGDTIRFVNTEKGIIRVSGRTKHYVNLATEHLTVDNMNAGIVAVEKALNVRIPEFTIVPVKDDTYIAHEWYVGTKDKLTSEKMTSLLDAALGVVNDDYKSERKTALKIKVTVVPLQLFYDWQQEGGQNNGQSKIPRVMKGEGKKRWLSIVGQAEKPDISNRRDIQLGSFDW
jgi:hypothetical protein